MTHIIKHNQTRQVPAFRKNLTDNMDKFLTRLNLSCPILKRLVSNRHTEVISLISLVMKFRDCEPSSSWSCTVMNAIYPVVLHTSWNWSNTFTTPRHQSYQFLHVLFAWVRYHGNRDIYHGYQIWVALQDDEYVSDRAAKMLQYYCEFVRDCTEECYRQLIPSSSFQRQV